ncbi:hypothetical protein BV22DRAFT_1034175 [Leucogyrophana mollusca]|uniref:Uncharacterized protein n=1 Tax=Leucogyrophana mollusca TaxID=85980 RepID=A0ACB8BIY9_9AGAM|nr:hypothetical protein BV22DRAFT_1034175 [Leucogyrophana mollusca]
MPTRTYTSSSVQTHYSPSAIPLQVWETSRQHAGTADTILPHVVKAFNLERSGEAFAAARQVWITYASPYHPVEFVLSCTEGPLGAYPIFVFTPIAFTELDEDYLDRSFHLLARAQHDVVGMARVFSVFLIWPVTAVFSRIWSELTGVTPYV